MATGRTLELRAENFILAHYMLGIGRPINFVKKVCGLTYVNMQENGLIYRPTPHVPFRSVVPRRG